ncbi:hypothetical protein MTO96_030076 [Rhipicephalus appendiculatus]
MPISKRSSWKNSADGPRGSTAQTPGSGDSFSCLRPRQRRGAARALQFYGPGGSGAPFVGPIHATPVWPLRRAGPDIPSASAAPWLIIAFYADDRLRRSRKMKRQLRRVAWETPVWRRRNPTWASGRQAPETGAMGPASGFSAQRSKHCASTIRDGALCPNAGIPGHP